MKTPKDIMMGLECCSNEDGACTRCPYMCGYGARCITEKSKDTLAYIQQLDAQLPKWINVKEKLPENIFERVLVFVNDENVIIGHPAIDTDRFDPIGKRWVRYGDLITHWMPLPDLPNGGKHD